MAFLTLNPVVSEPYVPFFAEETEEHTPRNRSDSVCSTASYESMRENGFRPLRLQQ
ncbi:hypothetical protein ACO0OL_002687 [Hanseniaspora opuntiae]